MANSIKISPTDLTRTFTLIARHDTHHFLNEILPDFLDSLSNDSVVKFRNYFNGLRSGEYIPKNSYSDNETEYVYLTVGQFSGKSVDLSELTFLDETAGEEYQHISLEPGNIVITRSGTVGTVHRFDPPDDKVYIPSHHLAVVDIPEDSEHSIEFIRLFLQSEFAKKYFWAFASGKSQKEISNWSIKSIPIPQCENPHEVADRCLEIEDEIESLKKELLAKTKEKEQELFESIYSDIG